MHHIFGRGEISAAWHDLHGPLVALAVSLVLALAAWRLRSALAAALGGGAAVVAGWYATIHPPLTLSPRTPLDRLTLLSAATLLIALAAERLAARRGVWPPLVVIALGCGWWLAGAPITRTGLLGAWPVELAGALAVVLLARLSGLVAGGGDPLLPAVAAFTLASALHVVGAPWIWVLVALVPGAAILPLMLVPRLPPLTLLPLAADIAASGIAVSLSAGRLARDSLTAVDAAALSPLLALWLLPHVAARLRGVGRVGSLLSALVCGAVAVGAAWGVMRLRR